MLLDFKGSLTGILGFQGVLSWKKQHAASNKLHWVESSKRPLFYLSFCQAATLQKEHGSWNLKVAFKKNINILVSTTSNMPQCRATNTHNNRVFSCPENPYVTQEGEKGRKETRHREKDRTLDVQIKKKMPLSSSLVHISNELHN